MDKEDLLKDAIIDLGINVAYEKGKQIPVKNCWHFSTDGNCIDSMFMDDDDFANGMNRVYVVSRQYKMLILAFTLMDTHIHFVLYGNYDECNKFTHEYLRRTSMYIQKKYKQRKKLKHLPVSHQFVDNDLYLKTVICYVIKNPPVGGVSYSHWDYPWSSGALIFNHNNMWTSRHWGKEEEIDGLVMPVCKERKFLKTDSRPQESVRVVDNLIFPGEYVETKLVEAIFKTCKSYNYFLCKSKEEDIEAKAGIISRLSIPIQEMRENRNEVCKELYGTESIRVLNINQRIRLAKILKSRYQSSSKQIARLCGLIYDEVKNML